MNTAVIHLGSDAMLNGKTTKRFWRSFSLRSFLVATTLLSLAIGTYIVRAKRQEGAVRWCLSHDGQIAYDSNYDFGKHREGPATQEQYWYEHESSRDFVSNVVQLGYTSDGSDPSPLTCLHELEMLTVRDARQSDLNMLDSFANLKVLHLEVQSVDDLKSLSGLASVEQLMLTNIVADDLGALSNLRLEYLAVRDSEIGDFADVSKIKDLRVLAISNTDVPEGIVEQIHADLPECHIQIFYPDGTVKKITPNGG